MEKLTHADMAKKLLGLIKSPTLQIPTRVAREYVELEDWLSAIAEGNLVVSNGDQDAGSHS